MEEVGTGQHKSLQPKYTLQEVLDPEFRLPRKGQPREQDGLAALKALAGKGVKVFKVDN